MSTAVAATALGAFTFGAGPAEASGSAASATAQLRERNCRHHIFQGSGGHWGDDVTCTGGWFQGAIKCRRFDNGYEYWHYGPVSGDGGTSTVYCDRDAYIAFPTYRNV